MKGNPWEGEAYEVCRKVYTDLVVIRGSMIDPRPLVSVVIPTRNRREKLRACLESIRRSDYDRLETIVIDDASDYDVKVDLEHDYPNVLTVRNPERRLLAYSRNAGTSKAKGKYVFFLDDDNVISPNAISVLVRALGSSERVAVASPIIYNYDFPDRVWTSYIRKGSLPGFYVLGAVAPSSRTSTFSFHDAFMVKKSALEGLGGFDSETFPIHFSELDFSYRLSNAGLLAVVEPGAKVWHNMGTVHMHIDSRRSYYTLRNRVILLKRFATKRQFRLYVTAILPFLTIYYVYNHARFASDHRVTSSFNLIKGVVDGLAFREPASSGATTPLPRESQRDERREIPEPAPLVSVVIPCKNSSDTIERCLQSIEDQTYKNLEIIVVDNHSTDNTVELAKQYAGVRILHAGTERSAQMNYGVTRANGRFVYRVDSDFVLQPHLIEEAVTACLGYGYKVLTIHNTSDETISFWSAVRRLERDCYEDDVINIAARFWDKSVFLTAGGFDESLVAAEDYELHNRLKEAGYKIGRIRSKEIHIGEPQTLADVVSTYVYYGKHIGKFIRLNPKISMVQLSPMRLAYLRHWKEFGKSPKLTLGFLLYQYVRYMAALAGFVSNRLASAPVG